MIILQRLLPERWRSRLENVLTHVTAIIVGHLVLKHVFNQ